MVLEKRIYLVRHGQTNANIERYCQGPDEPLSPEGKLQADRLADRVVHLDFEKVITSDYLRTIQTAEAILKRVNVPHETSEFLREEVWPSSFLHADEDDEKRRQYVRDLEANANNPEWRLEDGENVTDILGRVISSLDLLLHDATENILVVSHGNFLRQLIGYVLLNENCTPEEMVRFKYSLKTTNTGISILIHDGTMWKVLSWNDHAHFAE